MYNRRGRDGGVDWKSAAMGAAAGAAAASVMGGQRRYGGRQGGNVGGAICGSCCGIVFGIVLFLSSFGVLTFNERSAVRMERSLHEGLKAVTDGGDPMNPSADNQGKLVYFSGRANGAKIIADEDLGVAVERSSEGGLAALKRVVEMYQYKEHKHKHERKHRDYDGNTRTERYYTYSYSPEWSSRAISSSSFHDTSYVNPTHWPIRSDAQYARRVRLGALTLSTSIVEQVATPTPLHLDGKKLKSMQKLLGSSTSSDVSLSADADSRQLAVANHGLVPKQGMLLSEALAARGTPQIGDVRVRFEKVIVGDVTVVGKQIGKESIGKFKTSYNNIMLVSKGIKTSEEMFEDAQNANTMKTWLMRVVGFVMMFIGINMLLSPASQIASIVPFLGGMLSSLVSVGACLVATTASIGLSLATIAISWVIFRPELAIALVVIAAVPLLGLQRLVAAQNGSAGKSGGGDRGRRLDPID